MQALITEGQDLERQSRLPDATARYRSAIAAAARGNDSVGLAEARFRLGIAHWLVSQYDSAIAVFDEALAVRTRIGGDPELARIHNGIGSSYYQLGVYEQALEAFLRAVTLRRGSADTLGLARSLTNLGKTYQDWGQLQRARAAMEEAIAVSAPASNGAAALGYAWNSLAMVEIDAGRLDFAREAIAKSRAAYATPGALKSAADTSDSWEINAVATGLLLLREGRPDRAMPTLDSVLVSATRRRSMRARTRALLYLGDGEAQRGRPDAARARLTAALTLARSADHRVLALEALKRLAALESRANHPTQALRHLEAYQALRDTIFDQDAALRIATREARAAADVAERRAGQLQQEQVLQAATIARQRLIVALAIALVVLAFAFVVVLVRARRREHERTLALSKANDDLREALRDVQTLSGLIPICANCKKVRDDRGYWQAVETYVSRHSAATFSHSICQTCGPKLYGEDWDAEAIEQAEANDRRVTASPGGDRVDGPAR